MAAIRVSLLATTALGSGAANIRVRLSATEAVLGAIAPNLRARFLTSEATVGNFPNMRARFNGVEATVGNVPNLRTRVAVVECLQEVLEPVMSSLVFPTLQGLAFDVQKKPIFSTKLAEHVSGEETATSFYRNPKWEYTLTYDYLPDLPKQVGDTDLHTLMGLFLSMRGRGDTFLFTDPDDNAVSEGWQFDADGLTAQIKLVRGIGGFYEPVGQINGTPVLHLAVTENFSIPVTPGPYTHSVTKASQYLQTDSLTINGVAATVGTGPGQYTVAAGVYTFNAADQGKAVIVRYRWTMADPGDFTITMPNVINFTTAPGAGATLYATFNYYFVCRFLEDASQYTKFMDKLWNLSELGFRSIPQ
jgi:hypothetical protein